MGDEKTKAIGKIIGYIVTIVLVFLIVKWFTIDATYEYGWFAGGFHGAWVPYNWIRSLFDSAILVKAPLHTSAYMVFWWIGLITGIIALLNIIIGSIAALRKAFS